jgi:hypothetical protein
MYVINILKKERITRKEGLIIDITEPTPLRHAAEVSRFP